MGDGVPKNEGKFVGKFYVFLPLIFERGKPTAGAAAPIVRRDMLGRHIILSTKRRIHNFYRVFSPLFVLY